MQAIAEQVAPSPQQTAHTAKILGALSGRVLTQGGLAVASRDAGSETLFTGRSRPYSEAWLRQQAERIERAGGATACSEQVFTQVRTAAHGHAVTAFTDMFDQVWWTKYPAHAGPIGRLANRCLGAVYFGVTTVHIEVETSPGLTLALHLSAHKPATPLRDAIVDLTQDDARRKWLQTSVRLYVVDRGGNGQPTLRLMRAQGLPYMTMANRKVPLATVSEATDFTASGLPLRVERDERLVGEACADPSEVGPQRIVFPAHPDRGPACENAIVYWVDAVLSSEELRNLDSVYKGRWPGVENHLKAWQAVGFGVNHSRRVELSYSRGDEGELARSEVRQGALTATLTACVLDPSPKAARRFDHTLEKLREERDKAQAIRDKPATKNVRVVEGTGEMLIKWMMLLLCNAIAIVLGRSPIPAVRTMTPARLNELLLKRSAIASTTPAEMTLQLETIHEYRDRRHQQELVRVFDEAKLTLGGRRLRLRLRKCGESG